MSKKDMKPGDNPLPPTLPAAQGGETAALAAYDEALGRLIESRVAFINADGMPEFRVGHLDHLRWSLETDAAAAERNYQDDLLVARVHGLL